MKKILHVCTDQKFIDFAITNFNTIDNVQNDFFVIAKNELKYVKNENVTVESRWSFLVKLLLGKFKNHDAVIFHSLGNQFKLFIKFLPKKLKICWIGFGFDYYDYSKLIKGYAEKKGVKYVIEKYILNSSYQRINYFCPVLESEFEEASTRLRLNAQYLDWNYGSSDKIVDKLKNDYVDGDSILLGNSASETNNHLEIIDELVKLNETREIIVPLSYGNSNYAEMIIAKLKSTSLNYTVLRDFLTQEEYFSILKRCAFVIMNHKRQQAAGNILIMLSLGAKVILDKENPLHSYFKQFGFKIFEKTELKSNLFSALLEKDMTINKKLSVENFNPDVSKGKTERLVFALVS
ncbi:TDP-N-acetylfucosamine:lipid II N-acetylfucosaminyltransferase [Pseudoalteromonas sp. KG3]|uniref:TDP-N-acetylfucosamine:lipid II N-acetylfucosaminyltransferase n=1 Tax=Pseudoalteromonas sp. KG3 TaxID=2951137 RepID=UPI0026582F82|nr:TDP-N-acetylfucosamine:lipid II N-acetylfucosaminyltransferase [Pseudoalteromonas sp. KG3]WKD22018.1 TDP-N-acetylfucosamine:lipid II N-acetylfucosaminyltransferase [Pseudoalteromonas sp. KG3]